MSKILPLNAAVTATYLKKKVRGKIVGRESNRYIVQVDAADTEILRGVGYAYHTVIVDDSALLLR